MRVRHLPGSAKYSDSLMSLEAWGNDENPGSPGFTIVWQLLTWVGVSHPGLSIPDANDDDGPAHLSEVGRAAVVHIWVGVRRGSRDRRNYWRGNPGAVLTRRSPLAMVTGSNSDFDVDRAGRNTLHCVELPGPRACWCSARCRCAALDAEEDTRGVHATFVGFLPLSGISCDYYHSTPRPATVKWARRRDAPSFRRAHSDCHHGKRGDLPCANSWPKPSL